MSNIFKKAELGDDVKEVNESVGGGGFLVDSGVHTCTIEEAYSIISKKGSYGISFIFKTDSGATVRKTEYWRSGDAKGNKTTYTDKNGDEIPLPGFVVCNNIALLTVECELKDLDIEERTIELYDYDAKADVPTKVDSIVGMRGKKVQLGILKTLEDKNQQNDDGDWVPVGTREANEIDRVFSAVEGYEGFTARELEAGAEEPIIKPKWAAKWEGEVKDRASDEGKAAQADSGSASDSSGTSSAKKAPAKAKKSLFNK